MITSLLKQDTWPTLRTDSQCVSSLKSCAFIKKYVYNQAEIMYFFLAQLLFLLIRHYWKSDIFYYFSEARNWNIKWLSYSPQLCNYTFNCNHWYESQFVYLKKRDIYSTWSGRTITYAKQTFFDINTPLFRKRCTILVFWLQFKTDIKSNKHYRYLSIFMCVLQFKKRFVNYSGGVNSCYLSSSS